MTKTKSKNVTDYGLIVAKDIFSETQYYTVIKKQGDKVKLQNDNGENIVVDKKYVENCLISATQFTDEKSINKTEAANMLLNNPNTAMTVSFQKQVKAEDVIKEIMEAYEGSTVKTMGEVIKKSIKKALIGEERTIKGRHSGELNEFGRIQFVDMEITKDFSKDYDNRLRQIDPRTINYIILKGIKYTVK